MKKILLPAFLLFLITISKAQDIKSNDHHLTAVVDKRVELLSIAARLADYEEYNDDANKQYVQEIHTYFDKFKDHPLIRYMRAIRSTNSIGYDAVMSLAVHLSQPPELKPLVKFSKSTPDGRWGADTAYKFVRLLQQFYTDANCGAFFKDHENSYSIGASRFDNVLQQLDVNWYYKYYGVAPKEKFNIIVGLSIGGNNYGPSVASPDGHEDIYAIMGAWKFDSTAKPLFNKNYTLPTLIHEFNHSFVNPLNFAHRGQLSKSGEIIYQSLAAKMRRLAYGEGLTMMNEALVRASVVRYLMVHNPDTLVALKELRLQQSLGFVWLDQLVDLLGKYDAERNKYPTLDSFMPQIIAFYNNTATNIEQIKSDYAKKVPHVAAIEPMKNGNTTVSPTLTEIKIYFDKPLSPKGYSLNYGKLGQEHFAVTKFLGYSDDNKSVRLQVALKPDFEYEFILTGLSFKTVDGTSLEPYTVSFKTGK